MLNSNHPQFVDVRDVAIAHVNAMEKESAQGRHILVNPRGYGDCFLF